MKDTNLLQQELTKAQEQVTMDAIYSHYKHPDRHYKIVSIAFLESSEEVCVCYQALYAPYFTWIRPLSNFLEKVKTADGEVLRFHKQS
ncbi:DUF1653 domain-containing protein [Candidatus Gracilibacteria bacterium]|nr:DUF1653 domain-containing protein [Candidatus Gracilibacteria bacterium]